MSEYFPQDDSTYPAQVKKITVVDDVNPENANAAPEALAKRTDYLNAQLILLANSLANIDAYSKAETDQLLADLIDGAPDALNTLNELAAALNENDSELAALLAAINLRLTQVQAADMITNALAMPTLTGTATFTHVDNNLNLIGVGNIGLEVGDVVTFTNSVNNDGEFTVEVITDADNIIFNQAHAGGTTSKSLVDEVATANVTVALLSKWYNAPKGLGQGWVDVLINRSMGATYTNNTGRAIQLSATVFPDAAATKYTNLYIDGNKVGGIGQQSQVSTNTRYASIYSHIVPNGSTYLIENFGSALAIWKELR